MFGECHAHLIMDGQNYKKAVAMHRNGVNEEIVRSHLEMYQKAGVTFVRDGGDALGVSEKGKELAPKYGIDYRTPVFAIYKEGHYGGIVGHGFSDMREYHKRVLEAKKEGADFIKIMTTGILDFGNHGAITGTALEEQEVKEMVHIAHGEGLAVMSHTNGDSFVRIAVEAGVDSVEHGNYMEEDTIKILAESNTVWVPTLVTVRNLIGCGRFRDDMLIPIIKAAEKNLRKAYERKALVALGSDAGAHCVPHGQGIYDEEDAFLEILGNSQTVIEWIEEGERQIRERFKRRD